MQSGWSACVLSHVPLFCNHRDCSLPGSSAHGIFQARILEWVAISSSRGSSQGLNPCFLCLLCWQVGSLPLEPLTRETWFLFPGKQTGRDQYWTFLPTQWVKGRSGLVPRFLKLIPCSFSHLDCKFCGSAKPGLKVWSGTSSISITWEWLEMHLLGSAPAPLTQKPWWPRPNSLF